jgi:hypothetical protein
VNLGNIYESIDDREAAKVLGCSLQLDQTKVHDQRLVESAQSNGPHQFSPSELVRQQCQDGSNATTQTAALSSASDPTATRP